MEKFDIPEAEQSLQQAWEALAAAVRVFGPEWDEYLLRQRAVRVEAAERAVQAVLAELSDLQLIDDLLAREGVLHLNPQTKEELEATFARSQRRASLAMHAGGEDRGSEGRQYGLTELVLEHKHA